MTTETDRSHTWKWYICILLLLATVVNYMDRLTVNNLAIRIQTHFELNDQQYGHLELGFGLAFATGSLLFGWLVDRIGVYWLYPIALVGWSLAGFLTGLSRSYEELLSLRIMLGFFESGHFPCGLKVVQLLLEPRDRAMGNSLLQSGTALGAILAPQVIKALLTEGEGGWRMPFMVIGAGGCVWVAFWLASIRPRDLKAAAVTSKASIASSPAAHRAGEGASFLQCVFSLKYLTLAVMVVCINLNWHLFRVWMPKFLQQARGYSEADTLNFTSIYYLAADAGILLAGAVTSWLARRGLTVYASRVTVFFVCCLMTTMTTAAARLPASPMLLVSLTLVAFGGLGAFAAYYSMTQDLSQQHQGKISGSLSTITWLVTAVFHPLFGGYLDRTKNYDLVVGAMGWLPMLSLLVILLLWKRGSTVRET